jgi:hypothetical protein
MAGKINELVDKIAKLEDELRLELDQQQQSFQYSLEGTRVKFEESMLEAHRKLRVAILPWLRSSLLRNVVSAPFIYSMIIPLAFTDLTMTAYQHICFRLYGIQRVARSRYVVVDRHQLGYLNGIEKFNCVYCGYGNGVIAYAREIVARTEQYWCPIKHARRVAGSHTRYRNFVDYGDADAYQTEVLKLREALKDSEKSSQADQKRDKSV